MKTMNPTGGKHRTGSLAATAASLLLTFASAGSLQAEITHNCSQPVNTVTSCSFDPEDCWIETDEEHMPWLVPADAKMNNPKEFRAFCSPANATSGNSGHWYSYSIFLPPGYDLPENEDVHYPVVYWLMGSLKTTDDYVGRGVNVAGVLEQLILKRRIRPVIYVIPYGGLLTDDPPYDWVDPWSDGHLPDDKPGCHPDLPDICFRADSAFDELIEHVEGNYRVINRPEARAIEGFSRGGGYALQRGFRKVDGAYLFGSIAGISAAANWESSRYDPDAEALAVDYANQFPDDADRPIEIMLKHGDLDLDQSAEATAEFSVYLEEAILDADGIDPGVDPISHSIEYVVPGCGEERGFPPPCDPGDLPPPLGHDQPRMIDLRGNEIVASHQESVLGLGATNLARIDAHDLPCAALFPFVTIPPDRVSSNDAYVAGDWDGDGCDTIGLRHGGDFYVDNDFDHVVDDDLFGGPDDAFYFAIDWTDEGKDQLGFARYDTGDCPNSLEIKLYTDDRDGDGHDAKDEPVFCFEDAPPDAEIVVGDFDGDFRDDIGYRDGNEIFWTPFLVSDYTGFITGSTKFGGGDSEDQYAAGEWTVAQATSGLGIRRGNEFLLNTNLDGSHDIDFRYGSGNSEDQYLFGDWDGDGRTNVAIRDCHLFLLDTDFDAQPDGQFYFGWGLGDCDD